MNYSYTFEVRLHDVDHAGVMFFARLFVHAHDAYEAFMAGNGLALGALIERNVRLPIVHASADCLLPLRHDEKITVTLTVAKLGRTLYPGVCIPLRQRTAGPIAHRTRFP